MLETRPAPATVDLINGMYASSGGVNAEHALANSRYVPPGWAHAPDDSQDGNALYLGAVKPGCRSCHASASNPAIDFQQLSDWDSNLYRIRNLVCRSTRNPDPRFPSRGHDMPNAEQVGKVFWKSGARALILGYTQNALVDPTNPTASPFPDPLASCDP